MSNNENYTLEDLFGAWQQQSDRIDGLVEEHPLSIEMLNTRRISRHRRMLVSAVTCAVACTFVAIWLACLYKGYVNDVQDLIPHLVIGGILLYVIGINLYMVVFLLRHNVASTSPTEMFCIEWHTSDTSTMQTRTKDQPSSQTPARVQQNTLALNPVKRVRLSRIAALIAMTAVLIVIATPAYDGRSMSACAKNERTMILASSNHVIDNLTT